jgi:hypothetical protein
LTIVFFEEESQIRKEVKKMKYEKPVVVVIASLCGMIQSVEKLTGPLETPNKPSMSAYEDSE